MHCVAFSDQSPKTCATHSQALSAPIQTWKKFQIIFKQEFFNDKFGYNKNIQTYVATNYNNCASY